MQKQSTLVSLSKEDMNECVSRAEASVKHFAELYGEKGSGQYNHNEVSGNIIGA